MQVFKQTDHREDGMVLGSEQLGLYSPDKSAEGFAFAQLDDKRKKIHTVSDEAGLADVGLFRGGQSNHKAALLRNAGEKNRQRTEEDHEEAATLFCR